MCLLETHMQESRWFPLVWGSGVWDGAWMEPEETTTSLTSLREGSNFFVLSVGTAQFYYII